MLVKGHLTSHFRMSGSEWETAPSWLSGSLRSFLYSSMHSCHLFLISSLLLKWKWKWNLLSHIRLFATPWTTVHGILQARILNYLALPFSRESFQTRDWTGLLPCRKILYQLSHKVSPVSIRSLPFLSSIVPILGWNVPLIVPIFLMRSLFLPFLVFSSIYLYCSLKKAFLSHLGILWNSAFSWVYLSLPP